MCARLCLYIDVEYCVTICSRMICTQLATNRVLQSLLYSNGVRVLAVLTHMRKHTVGEAARRSASLFVPLSLGVRLGPA